ncbi:MAG: ImmA/IrrE family metallo-endopeptidase [Clostridia bacterium]|nr:ImmA/IrrE family metallo-endopeptidase [Clostridia bacterium]
MKHLEEDLLIGGYIKKQDLHTLVDNKIRTLGLSYSDYPIRSLVIAESLCKNIVVEYWKFHSAKVCGVLYKGQKESTIILNSLRSEKGLNFDCMHELIHYWFHPAEERLCIEDSNINQIKGREWQANEGAAQALMPVELFIQKYYDFKGDIEKLSDYFFVGEVSIKFRIFSLKNNIKEFYDKNMGRKSKEQNLKEIQNVVQWFKNQKK